MAMRKWKSLTTIPKWLANLWRVPQVAAKRLAWKLDTSTDQLEENDNIRPPGSTRGNSQSGRPGPPRSWSSWQSASTPSKSPSMDRGSRFVSQHEKSSPNQTLQPSQKPAIFQAPSSPSLECKMPISPNVSSSRRGPVLEDAFTLYADPDVDERKSQPGRRSRHLGHLIDKRMAILGTRLRVRESRNALRTRRDILTDMNAQFSQDLRRLAASSANAELKALLSQNEGIQTYREELQLKESEYNIFEDELTHMEWDMKEEEIKVYEQLSKINDNLPADDIGRHSDGGIGYVAASSSSTASALSRVSPLEQRWLSRIGDRNLLLEELQELRGERAAWVEEERIRSRVGTGLDEEAQHFLDTFDSRHESLKQDLVQVEADLAQLQEDLSGQADVFYSSTQFDEDGEFLDQSLMESSLGIASTDDSEPASKDPLFLGEDAHPVFSKADSDPTQTSISTVSYINEWLLHILRRSAIEVRRFKTTEELRPLHLDREQLARLVLEWWSKDSTVNIFRLARNHTAKSVSAASKASEQDPTTRAARSDSIIFSVDRIARRLQDSQTHRFGGATTTRVFHGPDFPDHSHHVSASSF